MPIFMGDIILPMTYVEKLDRPLIFIAGPIWGAISWYDKAVDIIHSHDDGIYVASPNALLSYKHLKKAVKGDDKKFNRCILWQRHYLEQASKKGAIMFWLPNEAKHCCTYPYGQDTRGEIAEWRGRLIYDKNIELVIGAEEKFPGLDSIKENYLAVNPDMKFYSTLEETCKHAVEIACNRNKN
jgi:hypothetical protein